jgi:PAS domain S-box-containing protein
MPTRSNRPASGEQRNDAEAARHRAASRWNRGRSVAGRRGFHSAAFAGILAAMSQHRISAAMTPDAATADNAREAERIAGELTRMAGGTDPFAAAMRATRMPMIITNPGLPDNPVVFSNNSFCRLTGYTRDEILGRNCRFLQGSDTDPATIRRIRAAVDARQSIETEILNYRKNGEPFWNRLLMAPVFDATGNVTYFFASQVDVTFERERMAGLESRNAALLAEIADRVRAFQESEARFRHMADSAPALIWMTDAGGRINFANMHFLHVLGCDPSEILDQGWARLVLLQDLPAFTAAFEQAFRQRAPFRAETRIRDRAGEIRWLRCEGVPRLDDVGTFLGYTGCNIDITEARLAADALEARVADRTAELTQALSQLNQQVAEREMAEEALRHSQKMEAVGQLTGGIAHDFNNMLQAISGGLQVMRRRIAQGRVDEIGEYLAVSLQGIDRAAALTHRLLAFARRQSLDPRAVAPSALVEGLGELIRRTVGPQVLVELQVDPRAGTVFCDANQLESVLLNLAINARDAMPDGGRLILGTRSVLLTQSDVAGQEGARPGHYVEISVADTGTGMTPNVLARAFEPFFTTKPTGQGTGLGLSQLYGFVRQSGGVISLQSEPGQGTILRLSLPTRADLAPEAADGDDGASSGPDGRVSGTVLLVEDDETVRRLVAETLRDLGCEVLEANDGPSGLRMLLSGIKVDMLVTDIGLPGLNGRQLADAARQRRPDFPVLLITGHAGTALEGWQRARGAEVMNKPFSLDTLAERVTAMLERG